MAFMLIIMIFWVPILFMLHYFCNLFHVYFEQMTKSDAVGGQLSRFAVVCPRNRCQCGGIFVYLV